MNIIKKKNLHVFINWREFMINSPTFRIYKYTTFPIRPRNQVQQIWLERNRLLFELAAVHILWTKLWEKNSSDAYISYWYTKKHQGIERNIWINRQRETAPGYTDYYAAFPTGRLW